LEGGCEDVEEEFGVGVCVNVAVDIFVKEFFEFGGVG